MRITYPPVQLELIPDVAHTCKPWRPAGNMDGHCQRCWCEVSRCMCNAGCWECGAHPGEPGCQYCWTADADGYRAGWWT